MSASLEEEYLKEDHYSESLEEEEESIHSTSPPPLPGPKEEKRSAKSRSATPGVKKKRPSSKSLSSLKQFSMKDLQERKSSAFLSIHGKPRKVQTLQSQLALDLNVKKRIRPRMTKIDPSHAAFQEIARLSKELEEQRQYIMQITEDKRTLQLEKDHQVKIIKQLQDEGNGYPELLGKAMEEARQFKTANKSYREKLNATERQLQHKHEEASNLKDKLSKIHRLLKSKNLTSNDVLLAKITTLEETVSLKDQRISELNRKISLQEKQFEHDLKSVRHANKDAIEEMEEKLNLKTREVQKWIQRYKDLENKESIKETAKKTIEIEKDTQEEDALHKKLKEMESQQKRQKADAEKQIESLVQKHKEEIELLNTAVVQLSLQLKEKEKQLEKAQSDNKSGAQGISNESNDMLIQCQQAQKNADNWRQRYLVCRVKLVGKFKEAEDWKVKYKECRIRALRRFKEWDDIRKELEAERANNKEKPKKEVEEEEDTTAVTPKKITQEPRQGSSIGNRNPTPKPFKASNAKLIREDDNNEEDKKQHKLNFLKSGNITGSKTKVNSQAPQSNNYASNASINSRRRRTGDPEIKQEEKPLRDMLDEMRTTKEIKNIGENGAYAPSFSSLTASPKQRGGGSVPKNGRRAQNASKSNESILDPFSSSPEND